MVILSRLELYIIRTASLQISKTHSNEFPGYDTKQSDGEAPVILEIWGMQSTPTLPSLPCLLRPEVVTPDKVLSMSQIKLFGI